MATAAIASLAIPQPATAARIAEVFFADHLASPTPNAIELDALATTGQSAVDLVILDATPSRAGQVLQVITIATLDGLTLVSDNPWPAGLWGEQTSPITQQTLEQLGKPAGTTWDFRFSRTLVLFDRPTNLVADRTPFLEQLGNLNGAAAVDWLTFEKNFSATAWSGEAIYDTAEGYVISRPYNQASVPLAGLVGMVDASGVMIGVQPSYAVTPGLSNQILHSPEPGAAGLLISAAVLFYARRQPIMSRHAR